MVGPLSFAGEDGGWSSSGGGEFVTNQHNPWFYKKVTDQNKKVTWCISHGGDKNFSITFDQAKKEIETAMKMMAVEIQSTFQTNRCLYYNTGLGRFTTMFCKGASNEPTGQYLNTNFAFTENCSDKTDLTFILGNPNHANFKEMLKRHGKDKVTKFGGLAVRTSYKVTYDKMIESKGFIYIGADRGEYRYSGVGALLGGGQSRDIWNDRYLGETDEDLKHLVHPHIDQNKEIATPFLATIIHELGHVYGFQHRPVDPGSNIQSSFNTAVRHGNEIYWLDGYKIHIMDESFVAKVISYQGLPMKTLKNTIGYFGLGINKTSGYTLGSFFFHEDLRIAVRLGVNPQKRRENSLGLIDNNVRKLLENQKALFFEFSNKKIVFSTLKYNKEIYACIPDTDYPYFTENEYQFKSSKECWDYRKTNDPKKFEFIKTKVAEAPMLIDSWVKTEKDALKFLAIDHHVSSYGIPFTVQSALNLITYYEKAYSFKIDLDVNGKLVPYMVRLGIDSDGISTSLEMTNLENFRTSRIKNEGLFFYDRKKPEEALPTFFE